MIGRQGSEKGSKDFGEDVPKPWTEWVTITEVSESAKNGIYHTFIREIKVKNWCHTKFSSKMMLKNKN